MEKQTPIGRLKSAGVLTLKPALSTIRFLLCITIPVSLAVLLLEQSGILHYIARFMTPLMGFLGLPGEASLAFLSSIFINLYSAIAVIQTLNLSGREIAILATMCLIAHNFIVESAVLKKTGSPVSRMVILRLASALLMGWILHFILPPSLGPGSAGQVLGENAAGIGLDLSLLPPVLLDWAKDMVPLILKIILIIFGLMFLQKILEEFGVIPWLGKVLGPLMTLFGLPPQTGYLWIVANMAGLVYGGAILIEQVRSNQVSISDAKLFNHHAAISHSQFEDTLLFMAVGVPFLWAALPRLILAVAVVWLERGRRILFRRSFRVRIVR